MSLPKSKETKHDDKVQVDSEKLPVKKYEPRNSIFTDFEENLHARIIYYICVTFMISVYIKECVSYYLYNKRTELGLGILQRSFVHFHLFALLWFAEFFSTLLLYFGFRFWVTLRIQFTPKSIEIKIWDRICLISLLVFYAAFTYFTPILVIKYNLGVGGSAFIITEGFRMFAKMHAFVRTSASNVLNCSPHTKASMLYPKLSHYLYFLFAPTLVYRESYPRSKGSIRWKLVLSHVVECIILMLFMCLILEQVYFDAFKDYGLKPHPLLHIPIVIFMNAHFGFLLTLLSFYFVLHSWSNTFAEVLRFSDRLFYKDWWTSISYERYYRTWNVIVHDWFYIYVYKDFYDIVIPKNKLVGKLMVLLISGIFHELVLAVAFRFFVPYLFIMFFVVGSIVITFKFPYRWLFLYFLGFGFSINVSMYSMEYITRWNCPLQNPTISSYFIPRLLNCPKLPYLKVF